MNTLTCIGLIIVSKSKPKVHKYNITAVLYCFKQAKPTKYDNLKVCVQNCTTVEVSLGV